MHSVATTDGHPRSGLLNSVANAARLLKLLRDHREIGVSEAARHLGVGTSTAFRLLRTLTDEKLLEPGTEPGTYRLGLAIYELGVNVSANLTLHQAAMPMLAGLRHSTGETVQMSILDHLEVVFIERLESPQTLRFVAQVGHRLPAHATSTGKVMLAHLPPDVLRERLQDWTPIRLTPHTITTEGALMADLRLAASRGWALNNEESSIGAMSVGAPIRDAQGFVVAALSVVTPVGRSNQETMRRNVSSAMEAAALVSERLGYRAAAPSVKGPDR